jgi:hypothetical protein
MNNRRLLWILVAADVLLSFASVGAEGFFGWTMPAVLSEYRRERFTGFTWTSATEVFRLMLLGATALCAFAAWIGLASFWRSGRRVYLASLSLWVLFVLFSGPQVRTSVGTMFMVLNALVSGVILGLVYFTDLARHFERDPVERTAPAGASLGAGRA